MELNFQLIEIDRLSQELGSTVLTFGLDLAEFSPALDRAAHAAVDTAELLAAGDFRQRRSDHGTPYT